MIHEPNDSFPYIWMDGCINGQMGGCTGRQVDGYLDGWMIDEEEKESHRHTGMCSDEDGQHIKRTWIQGGSNLKQRLATKV